MISAFAEHRHDGVHQDPGRADNQSEAVSQFHPSFSGAVSSLRPSWAIADDIFWERYGTALRGTEGSWRALPHLKALSGQLHATAAGNTSFQVPSEDFFDGPSSAIDPWLLHPSSNGDSPSLGGPGGRAGQPPVGASASHHHLLFQYKPYSQQEPLHLSEQDVAAVLEVAFGKVPYGAPKDENTATIAPAGGSQTFTLPRPASSLWGGAGGSTVGGGAGMNQSPSDVACVVLVKLIMDLYLAQGPQLTFSMVHFMLQRALLNGDGTARARVFDLIMNLAVHGELLYDAPGDQVPEDDAAVVEAVAKLDRAGPSADWRHTVTSALRASLAVGLETPTSAAAASTGRDSGGNPGFGNPSGSSGGTNAGLHQQNFAKEDDDEEIDGGEWPPLPRPSPIGTCHGIDPRGQRFRQWLRLLLFRMLSVLCSVLTNSSSSDTAWAAAASCLAVLSTHEGQVVRSFVQEMPLEAAAALLQQSKEQEWPHSLRCWIGCLAVNLMYTSSGTSRKQNSTTTGGVYGGGGDDSGSRGKSGEVLFSLDASRLKAFGGIRAVIRNYLDAPTLKCRRAFFCVMFDYLANDGGSNGDTSGRGSNGGNEAEIDVEVEAALSQARSLLQAVHSSQKDALGAALLYTRAAEALCPIFKLSFGSYNSGNNNTAVVNPLSQDLIYDIAADITAQIAAVHALYPEQVVQSPPGVVEQSLRALLAMVSAAGAPTAAVGSARDEENELEKLCTALKEGSIRAETDLLRMLMEFADKELAASASAGRQPSGGLIPPRFPSPSPPAGGGNIAGGKITSLASVLEQSLPNIRGHAASAFIRAVHALLDYVQLATAGLAATSWQRIDFPSVALQTISVAIEWLNLAPPGARQRALAAAAERAVAVLTVRKIDPILSFLDVASTTSNTAGNTTSNVLSGTISNSNNVVQQGSVNSASGRVVAAREDLSQQEQQQQQQPALEPPLQPQQFNDFNAVRESNIDHLAGGHKPSSPLSKIMPVPKLTAAWRRLTNPHHGGGGGGGASASGGGLSPTSIDARQQQQQAGNTGVNEQVRPLSAGLSSLSGAEREAASISTAPTAAPSSLPPRSPAVSQTQQQQQQQTVYQPHRSRQFSFEVSLLSLAAERALYERHAAAEAELGCAEAAAAAETKLTSIDSFLSGLSEVVPEILSQVPIEMLQSLMEGLKPEILWTSSPMSICGVSGGGGISLQARTESQSRVSAVQAGRPLWDARAAVAILLLRQVNRDSPTSTSTARGSLDISFIASLLSDSDPRVRRHASTFILTRFSQRKAQQYRIAVREVVARAQQGDDDGLLKSAEAQVKAMLEARLMNLEGLV